MIRRILAIGIAIAALLMLAVVPTAYAGGITRLCGIGFTSWTPTRCFAPDKVGSVEKHLAVRPIRPSAAVVPETHLRLRRVVLLDAPRPGGIEYLYGKIPKAVDGLPAFSLPHPRYVLVTEQIGASAIPGGRLVYSDGHWEYQAHFRCHALTLLVESNLSTVETNLSGRPISRLGKRILGLERCTGN